MITNVKRFGSYVLTTKSPFLDEIEDKLEDNDVPSLCAIPPSWTALILRHIEKYNYDTSIFTFCLPEGRTRLNLPVGGFLLILAPGCEHDGGDAIRPYTSISDDPPEENLVQSSSADWHPSPVTTGSFSILVKRYDEWGVKETPQTHFLFTKTNHSYKPPGAVSNYIHRLKVGDKVLFKHTPRCLGRVPRPLPASLRRLVMLAVGVGVAPVLQIAKHVVRNLQGSCSHIEKIVLLYGVRTVSDILLRATLDELEQRYPQLFQVVYCVGSRYAQVTWGCKKKDEYGWVTEEKIKKYAPPPSEDTKVIVCGLPGVYEKLCGYRDNPSVNPDSALGRLGYTDDMVIKL
eukprot:gene27546-33272_t